MKISFKKIILGGFFLSNLYIWGISIPIEKYTCPIGNEKFEDRYPAQCPTNKFVIFKNDFTETELKKYEKVINSKSYREIPKNASRYYYLARFYELVGEFSDKKIGKAYFDAYFYDRSSESITKESLQKSIRYLEKTVKTKNDEEALDYLATLYSETEEFLGFVYNNDILSTEKKLEQAIIYIDRYISYLDSIENTEDKKTEKIRALLIKVETNRRLKRFDEAEKILKNIPLKDINKTLKLDYDTLKEKVKSKNSEVIQYFPLQIMY